MRTGRFRYERLEEKGINLDVKKDIFISRKQSKFNLFYLFKENLK
jgi:hypothetical protein